jgi:ribosome-associated protein
MEAFPLEPKHVEVVPVKARGLEREIEFVATRSSGPGGQHVNKVSTRVELRFPLFTSALLDEREKALVYGALKRYVTMEGILILQCQDERSQTKNKEKVLSTFYALMAKALTPRKKRKPTRPTAASRVKRLESKRLQSKKKVRRKIKEESGSL